MVKVPPLRVKSPLILKLCWATAPALTVIVPVDESVTPFATFNCRIVALFPKIRIPSTRTELARAGVPVPLPTPTVTVAVETIVTSSAEVGTTPPTQVPPALQLPPAAVLDIGTAKADPHHSRTTAVISRVLPRSLLMTGVK